MANLAALRTAVFSLSAKNRPAVHGLRNKGTILRTILVEK